MTVKSLIQEYMERRFQATERARITKQHSEIIQLIEEYGTELKKLSAPQDEIAAELEVIARDPCRKDSHEWIVAAQIHPSLSYLESLCAILEYDDDCVVHESVVDILYDLADERSIPSLEKALAYDPPYDPTRELAVKILETLAQIGTPKAIAVLKKCLDSSSERIREEAELLLEEEED